MGVAAVSSPTAAYVHESASVDTTNAQSDWTTTLKSASTTTKGAGTSGSLPLGDGQYSREGASVGKIFIPQDYQFHQGVGSQVAGPWIDQASKTYTPSQKPVVEGDVHWAGTVSNVVAGDKRLIDSNGVPPSSIGTGTFPVNSSSQAYQYDKNPNSISAKPIHLELPSNPQLAAQSSPLTPGLIGVTTTGVAIYNGLDEKGDDAAAHEIQDKETGHPDASSQYHYHEIPPDLVKASYDPSTKLSGVVGYAIDGFPITGNQFGDKTLKTADLDKNHGTTGQYMQDGVQKEGYHYVATEDYPHTLSAFAGTPVLGAKPSTEAGQTASQGTAPQQTGSTNKMPAPPNGMSGPPNGMPPPPNGMPVPPSGTTGAPNGNAGATGGTAGQPNGVSGPPGAGAVDTASILKTLEEAKAATASSDKAAFVMSAIQQIINFMAQKQSPISGQS